MSLDNIHDLANALTVISGDLYRIEQDVKTLSEAREIARHAQQTISRAGALLGQIRDHFVALDERSD